MEEKKVSEMQKQEAMPEQKPKGTHGGHRDGAGRSRTDHGRYTGFYPTREVEAVLNALETSKTTFLNEAVMALARARGLV